MARLALVEFGWMLACLSMAENIDGDSWYTYQQSTMIDCISELYVSYSLVPKSIRNAHKLVINGALSRGQRSVIV